MSSGRRETHLCLTRNTLGVSKMNWYLLQLPSPSYKHHSIMLHLKVPHDKIKLLRYFTLHC